MANGKIVLETNTHNEPVYLVDMSSHGETMREVAGNIAAGAHKKALEWLSRGRTGDALRLVQYVSEVATAIRMIQVNHTAEVMHPEASECLPGIGIVSGRNGKFHLELPPEAHANGQPLNSDTHAEAAAEIIDRVIRQQMPALTREMEQATARSAAKSR